MKSKAIVASACFAFIFLLTGCSKNSNNYNNNNPPASGNNITISGMSFSPATKTVPKGTVVKWVNNGGSTHTATSNDGTTFDSGDINAGGSYSYTANTPGTFQYHCTIHGLSMAGTLVVNP